MTSGGFVFFVENGESDSTYSRSFIDTTRAQNAGFNYEGDDLDGDGRPECFLGSLFFGGLVNVAVYETIGDNDYEVSLWIEIKGIGALKRGLVTGDVDGDGKDELVVHLGGVVLILKPMSDDDYKLMWMKAFTNEIGVRLFDVNEDGIKDLIIAQQRFEKLGSFSEIYSFKKPVNVGYLPYTRNITMELYPNPIVSVGNIIIIADKSSHESSLDIYTLTGCHVKTLYLGSLEKGYNSILWTINSMQPGVYFLRLQAGSKMITKKVIHVH